MFLEGSCVSHRARKLASVRPKKREAQGELKKKKKKKKKKKTKKKKTKKKWSSSTIRSKTFPLVDVRVAV